MAERKHIFERGEVLPHPPSPSAQGNCFIPVSTLACRLVYFLGEARHTVSGQGTVVGVVEPLV